MRDTKLHLNLRSYYFRLDNIDGSVSSAWAMGGALAYQSGWLLDRLTVGATFYWSDKLYGPLDKDGTMLLKPGQHGYSVLGQLYARVKLFDEHILNLYRYEYNTPFIGKNDGRMAPNTFEGYTFQGILAVKTGLQNSGTEVAISAKSKNAIRINSSGCRAMRARRWSAGSVFSEVFSPMTSYPSAASTTIRAISLIFSIPRPSTVFR